MFDAKAFSADVIDSVKGHVAREMAPVLARAVAAETRVAELEERLAAVEARPEPFDCTGIVANIEVADARAFKLEQRLEAVESRPIPSVEGLVDKEAVDTALSPVIERIAELEKRAPVAGPKGDPGERGEPGQRGDDGAGITDFVRGEDGRIIVTLSNGTTRDLGSFKGEKGDTGERGLVGPQGEPGPQGEKGEKGEPGERGEAGPQGERGEPGIQGEKGDPGERGEMGPQGEKGARGHDVRDIAVTQDGAVIELAFTVADERSIFEVELPAGPAGEKGDPGPQGDAGPQGNEGDAGQQGERGADGLGFEEMDEYLDEDGRTLVRRYARGDEVKEFRHKLGIVLDKGVWREGMNRERGDMVSCGGNLWIAQRDTTDRPGTSDAWRMAIKRPDRKPAKGPSGD